MRLHRSAGSRHLVGRTGRLVRVHVHVEQTARADHDDRAPDLRQARPQTGDRPGRRLQQDLDLERSIRRGRGGVGGSTHWPRRTDGLGQLPVPQRRPQRVEQQHDALRPSVHHASSSQLGEQGGGPRERRAGLLQGPIHHVGDASGVPEDREDRPLDGPAHRAPRVVRGLPKPAREREPVRGPRLREPLAQPAKGERQDHPGVPTSPDQRRPGDRRGQVVQVPVTLSRGQGALHALVRGQEVRAGIAVRDREHVQRIELQPVLAQRSPEQAHRRAERRCVQAPGH